MNERMDELDLIKIKHVCSLKDTGQEHKKEAMAWEKTFAKHASDKALEAGYTEHP